MAGLDYCFKTNNDFLRKTHAGRIIILRKDGESPQLRELLSDPDRFLAQCEPMKNSRTTKAGIVSVGTFRFFVKRTNNKGLRFTLRYLFRSPRAFRAWQAAWFLRRLSVPTPENLAVLSVRRGPFLKAAYLVTEAWENTIPTLDYYQEMAKDPGKAEMLIRDIMRYLAFIHCWGIRHRDLKLSNIFVRPGNEGKPVFGFWDLDGLCLTNHPLDAIARSMDLARLSASFREIGHRLGAMIPMETVRQNIIHEYESRSGCTVDTAAFEAREALFLKRNIKETV